MPNREKVIKALEYCTSSNCCKLCEYWMEFDDSGSCRIIKDALSMLKEQEAKHGKWLESKILEDCLWVCSECEFPSEAFAAPVIYKYCPNCGVKIDRR